ncbi:unnamed protein product [Rotaria sordida]|uniref:MAM domain-containing protein n=1 Tax=Rotaria sordida TaxID=392033 RepID=A0A813WQB0_9BILA|nr:unnamed protein product [Rotaria sordida]CAF3843441.1 unnamed protein product [Rotaria sordida]
MKLHLSFLSIEMRSNLNYISVCSSVQILSIAFSLAFIFITTTSAQILYKCNFDNATISNTCFSTQGIEAMLLSDAAESAGNEPPTSPLSDVTSSLTPTSNGELCILPYKIDSYSWDMFFCNRGYCPTTSNQNTKCTPGKFGFYYFVAPKFISFPLNIGSGGINGTNQQCLTYYYYLPNITRMQHSINIRKEETGSSSEIIDNVISSPFNGWIRHQVNFTSTAPGYKIYFELEKKSGSVAFQSRIAIDEISIHQGSCFDEPLTQSTATILITSIESMTTDVNILTNIPETSIEQTTSIATTERLTTFLTSEMPSTIFTTTTSASTMISLTTIAPTSTTTMSSTVTTSNTSGTSTTTSSTTAIPSMTTTTMKSTTITISEISATTTTKMFTSTTTSIDLTTGNVEPTSTTSVSYITTTTDDVQITSSVKLYVIILATVIPIGTVIVIILTIWLKYFVCNKKPKSNIFEMNRVRPAFI